MSVLVELSRAACRTPHESIVELLFDHLSTLDGESGLSSALAAIDIREVHSELLESLLCYAPYTIELFFEACILGDLDLVQRGIDVGHRPDSEDKWARSPLHLAAAQGRILVIQLFLDNGTDVNHVHATYSTALVTALEGLSADKLRDKSTEESDRLYVAGLEGFEDLRCDFIYPMSKRCGRFSASEKEYAKTIGLLLSNGARVDDSPSRFGTALSLATFAGLDEELIDSLILHGAKAHVTGGILGFPISAAIDQGHMEIVDRLLGMAKSSAYHPGPGNTDLHRACEIGNLSLVSKLLDLGHKPGTADSEGKTALQISLNEMGMNAPEFESSSKTPSDQARIVHLLMDAEERPILIPGELVAVTEIWDSRCRNSLIDRILASLGQHKIPEETFIHLLRTRDLEIIKQMLDKQAVTSVSTTMLTSAYDVDTLVLLLEYNPSYIVTSATIDAVQTGQDSYETRGMTEMLLLRSPSLRLTESQVYRALASYRRYSQDENPLLLDLLFTRNPDLSVT